MMIVLRRLGTPLGGAFMLLMCGLPWAKISCGDVRAEPNLWNLADEEWKLYVCVLYAVLLILLGVLAWVWRSGRWRLAAPLVSLAALGTWVYLWLEREKMVARQLELQGLGGEIGRLLSELEVHLGSGFLLYGAGVLVALAFSVWDAVASRAKGTTELS